MKALRRQGVVEIYANILEDIIKESTATIKLHKVSEKTLIKKGVRQGNTFSPKLFTVVSLKNFFMATWSLLTNGYS